MSHVGVICPNAPGHLNPMVALADAMRNRGHRVTFFLLGAPPRAVTAAGFEVVNAGSSLFPAEEYEAAFHQLGFLTGRAALKHTFSIGGRANQAILEATPGAVRQSGVSSLLVDQATAAGGIVAGELGLPFATICNALILHQAASVPPFFTAWAPHDTWWTRLRNRLAWAQLDRLYRPILAKIQEHCRRRGLAIPARISDIWSSRLQISQQPQTFEFPRGDLPKHLRFVGPMHKATARPSLSFPWDKLDGRPLVYASLGTLQNGLKPVFRAILEGLSTLEAQIVLALGRRDAAWDEPVPANAIVVDYAPQIPLIERSSLVITHCGLNTTLESLAQGKPMVCIPVTNDQPGVAARVAHVGAGRIVPLAKVTAARLRAAVAEVVREPRYRSAAESIRQAIHAGGGPQRAAELIEQSLELGA